VSTAILSLDPRSGVSGAKRLGGTAAKKKADMAKANPQKPDFFGITLTPLLPLFIIRF
jgi:hypothetical protein